MCYSNNIIIKNNSKFILKIHCFNDTNEMILKVVVFVCSKFLCVLNIIIYNLWYETVNQY